MTATVAAITTTCRAEIGRKFVDASEVGVMCTQTVGLRVHVAADGTPLAYCPREGHRERVERYAARNHAAVAVGLSGLRCRCGSYQDGAGCDNADCGNWRGPGL